MLRKNQINLNDGVVRFVAIILLAILILGLGGAVYLGGYTFYNAIRSAQPEVYSESDLLQALWYDYKERHIEADTGRTIDYERNASTSSEGQSYTMMRSVWMDDPEMFDDAWRWTKDNLRHENDMLFAWLFGEREDGTYGVLYEEGGDTAASDSDVDIAFALVQAYGRWGRSQHLEEAREVLANIWEREVIEIDGDYYLLANDIEKFTDKEYLIINPSYYAPYAYRLFAQIDQTHPWEELVDTSYELVHTSLREELDKETSAQLPPDWLEINRNTGELRAAEDSDLTSNYGFDAMRVPWRIALDWEWNKDPRAVAVLSDMDFLVREWKREGRLYASYEHDGTPLYRNESLAMYGTALGLYKVIAPEISDDVFKQKILSNYDRGLYTWDADIGYYSSNWAWFGTALYFDKLPNYTAPHEAR